MTIAEKLTTWNLVTKTITGTAATAAIIVTGLLYYQPVAKAKDEHAAMTADFHLEMSQHQSEQTINSLEAELERIELALKLFAQIRERRALTPDEQDEYEYLKARRLQIRERLFDK